MIQKLSPNKHLVFSIISYAAVFSCITVTLYIIENISLSDSFESYRHSALLIVYIAIGIWVGYSWNSKSVSHQRRNQIMRQLSAREKEIVSLLLAGDSNKLIAEKLFIGMNTIKTHIRNIYRKAECSNRNEFKNIFRD